MKERTKDYYANLYYANQRNLAWEKLKQKPNIQNLKDFVVAFQNSEIDSKRKRQSVDNF